MTPPYRELTLSAQTAYAQLLDAALAAEHFRSVADLRGSFATKSVRGRTYWYFQYTEPSGKLRQLYVGPDTESVRRLAARKHEPGVTESLAPLARAALALGCVGTLPRHYRVIRRLADYGFFAAGGVLVGTHAFLALGNQLGVAWSRGERTQDVDFAHAGKSVVLALPTDAQARTAEAIESLGMGFLPIGALSGPGAGFLIPREPEFRLDFLTPRHRRDAPFLHPQLNVMLQPLKFMEFPLEDVGQAVVFCDEGAVVVNLPDPARFAIHKLIVAGERQGSGLAKAGKDRAQAAAVIGYLERYQPDRLVAALGAARAMGPGWRSRLARAAGPLRRVHPELEEVAARLRRSP